MNAYCLLGSNLNDRAALLREAVFRLACTPGIELCAVSQIYETQPWGKTDQPLFLNAAAQIETTLDAEALLNAFQSIESAMGRQRNGERWGPRLIDVDLALYGNEVIQTPRLTVPHADLHRRPFALIPLLEIAPDAKNPTSGRPLEQCLEELGEAARSDCVPRELLWTDLGSRPLDVGSGFREGLFVSHTSEQTEWLAGRLASLLQGGETLALAGTLGVGKTCFTRGFGRALGIKEPITSPSYVLVKTYEGGRLVLHHADFYRLSESRPGASPEPPDLASVGLDDYLGDPEGVVLIEWADRFPDWLEPPVWLVQFHRRRDDTRLILIKSL